MSRFDDRMDPERERLARLASHPANRDDDDDESFVPLSTPSTRALHRASYGATSIRVDPRLEVRVTHERTNAAASYILCGLEPQGDV